MVVLGVCAISYERGTSVGLGTCSLACLGTAAWNMKLETSASMPFNPTPYALRPTRHTLPHRVYLEFGVLGVHELCPPPPSRAWAPFQLSRKPARLSSVLGKR